MKIKIFAAIAIAFCLSFSINIKATAQTSSGVSASHVGPVTKVMFKNGYFEKNANGDWDEYFLNGQVRFPFRETGTSRDSVFLRNDSLMVDIELNMAKGEIWAEWPGQFRHKMHKITNAEHNAPLPPTITPPNPPAQTPNGVRLNSIEYSGGKLSNMGNSEWADYRDNSDAVHLYNEVSNSSDAVYLYSDSAKRLYRADFATQILKMATNGGPLSFHSAITAMSGVSANPPSIPAPPQPVRPGTLSPAERASCLASGGKVERAGILGAERCTKPYSDGGKPCADSSQCDGQCRAPSGKEMGDISLGVCQMDDNPFGCHAEVSNGIVEPTLCAD